MEEEIDNGKIINQLVPEAVSQSQNYAKEIKKRIKLNGIFLEFENKASHELNFYLDESNRRYSKSKCGINLKSLIASTRKKCLDESIKMLNDNFYNNKIIEEERNKMKYKSGKKYYKKIKNTFNIIRNPEIKRKEINLNAKNISDIDFENDNYNGNNKYESIKYNNNKNNSVSYRKKVKWDNKDKDKNKINEVMNNEYKTIYKSLDNYKENLKKLESQYNAAQKEDGKNSRIYLSKKILFDLPRLNLLNYAQKKVILKDPNEDDEKKKVDIHKLLPYSKYAKYFYDINPKKKADNKSTKKENNRTLPYITEPNVLNNSNYYKNYNNTIAVVANSANKEVFVNQNFDKKRNDIESIFGVDDIPNIQSYEKIAHENAFNKAKKRRERNELISKQQNFLKLTSKQRMNVEIEKNLNLIKNIENSLWTRKKDII